MNSIFARRSIRNFTDKDIERDKIDQLLKAAMQAPSAGNQRPWEFLVVSGKNNLETLSKFSPYAGCIKGANLAIVVLGNKHRMLYPENWEQDLSCACQNIMLEATDMGLGSVWLGTAPDKGRMDFISKLYKLEESNPPFAVIALGYPKDEDANKFIDRYEPSRVRYIKED